MTVRITGQLLYVADLLERMWEMENGQVPMVALRYRLLAKRLQTAQAGHTPAALQRGFPERAPSLLPILLEALETRHFAEFGCLQGSAAADVGAQALSLLRRLQR